MNPDIQRIAEKWDIEWRAGHIERQALSIHSYISHALTELDALRDTQEMELREKASDLERKLQKAWLTIDELNERYIEDNI